MLVESADPGIRKACKTVGTVDLRITRRGAVDKSFENMLTALRQEMAANMFPTDLPIGPPG